MRALRYALEEAFTSLWRGRQAGLLSTLTIALALFVLGGFLVVTANLERLGNEWSNAAELSVYLKDDITAGDRRAVEMVLAPSDVIAAHEYVSKTDALARLSRRSATSPRRWTAWAATRCRRRWRSGCVPHPAPARASIASRRACGR